MNERIRQLAEQAGMTDDKFGLFFAKDRHEEGVDLEKFAELIVGECMGVVEDAVNHREPASTYVGKIREHFGVEE